MAASRPPARRRRTLKEIRDEIEGEQKERVASHVAGDANCGSINEAQTEQETDHQVTDRATSVKNNKSSARQQQLRQRTGRSENFVSELPEDYAVPIHDENYHQERRAQVSSACESFRSCGTADTELSNLSTVPMASLDRAVVTGLRICATSTRLAPSGDRDPEGHGNNNEDVALALAQKAKRHLLEEREKERQFRKHREKREMKSKGRIAAAAAAADSAPASSFSSSRKTLGRINSTKALVRVLEEELHGKEREVDVTSRDNDDDTLTTCTDLTGLSLQADSADDADGSNHDGDDNGAAGMTACQSVWSIQSDATRKMDNRSGFTKLHFSRTV